MAIEYVDSTQLDADLTSVANAIRTKSGGSSQLAFPAGFVSEIQAIPSGGGLEPPVNSLAQFPISAELESYPTGMVLNISDLLRIMSDKRSYLFSLVLWRNDIVSATAFTNLAGSFFVWGRMAKTAVAANVASLHYSARSSMTSGVQGNTDNVYSSNSYSPPNYTLGIKADSGMDFTGSFSGIFTLLAPWTDNFTGTKLTECPSGFLTFH